jgi:hypothetical protein
MRATLSHKKGRGEESVVVIGDLARRFFNCTAVMRVLDPRIILLCKKFFS